MRNKADDQKAQKVKKKLLGNTYKVVGSLRDSVSGEFVAYVNVGVLERADSTFVKGTSTNLDGYFEVTDIPAGDYLLRVSAIGYRNFYLPFTVENNTALGTLRLKPGSTTLKEVKISADRPLYAMDGEKMIYNVSDDPSIQTGTTNDALQNAPGVEVDIEGNITLRGVSSVEIWVNDKPSKLTEENLKTYLETLPANALARIETITNPSAKYATEAEAVINIITSAHIKSNQFVSFGLNGSSQPFVSPWISYMWAKERLSVNIYASGRYNFNKNESGSRAYMRRDNAAGDGYDTVQIDTLHSYSENRNLNGNIFMNINYSIDSMSDLEVFGDIHGRRPKADSYGYGHSEGAGWTRTYYDTNSTSPTVSLFGGLGATYTHKFDQNGHNLRISADMHLDRDNSESRSWRLYDEAVYQDMNYNKYYRSHGSSQDYSIDARYNRPYSLDGELSFGLSFDHRHEKSSYERMLYNAASASYDITDSLRSYDYDGRSDDLDGDINWTHRWGGFTLELGMGMGYRWLNFNYDNYHFPDDTTLGYLTYNPSIHLSYRTESMHNFKLNYSLRMRNPSERQLTKFRQYGEDSYSVGNPSLKPSLTHNAEVGWTKFFERFGSVGLEGYARYSTDEIDNLTDHTDGVDAFIGRVISFSTPYNMGSSYRFGLSSNITYRPSGFFNLRLYLNAYESGYNIDYRGEPRSDNMFSYSARLNGWVKLFNRYQVHSSLNYSSPTQGLLSERKARYFFNLGVRADFFKRKMSVFVNVQDLFNWGARYGSGNTNTNPYYLSESTNLRLNSRFISAGITFRFGKMELERNAKEGTDESGE